MRERGRENKRERMGERVKRENKRERMGEGGWEREDGRERG